MYILDVHASHLFVRLCICMRIQAKINHLCIASQRELICLGLSHLFYKTGDGCIKWQEYWNMRAGVSLPCCHGEGDIEQGQ